MNEENQSKATQREKVLTLLKLRAENGISAIELDRTYGIYRASARILELRKLGYDITTINAHGKTAVYVLKPLTDLGDGYQQMEVFA